MEAHKLTLVLVTEGPARLAAPVLSQRFPNVRCEGGALLVGIARPETPEAVLAYCREQHVEIVASCVVQRTTAPRAA